ncbi:MAG: hypothetical protein RIQ81_2449 [Pseudomonadota bacterium]
MGVFVGILEKFKTWRKSQQEGKIAKAAKAAKNAKAIREDRWAALELLCDVEDAEQAIPALLQRFEFSLENGINDAKEKELAMGGITRFKDRAVPLVMQHLASTTRIAWPIKILRALGDDQLVVEGLKKALNFGDTTFDQAQTDKNYDLLCHLVEFKLGSFASELGRFLSDPDERVRFAAAEVMIEQNELTIVPLLEGFLMDQSVENIRIRQAVLRAFVERQWPLQKPEQIPGGEVIPGVYVTTSKTLAVRGQHS